MRNPILAIALLALVPGPARAGSEAPKAVRDADFSLARGSVFEVPSPPAVEANDSDPGERPLPGRSHPEMPPAVPHGIVDFLPITRADNPCVDCHAVETREPGEPTPIPPSHFVDFRDAPGVVGETLAAERHVCVSCHVGQTDAAPLVANPFTPAPAVAPERAPDVPSAAGPEPPSER